MIVAQKIYMVWICIPLCNVLDGNIILDTVVVVIIAIIAGVVVYIIAGVRIGSVLLLIDTFFFYCWSQCLSIKTVNIYRYSYTRSYIVSGQELRYPISVII